MKMIFKAIIFDMDGTLLDTLGDIASSMNTVLRLAGFPEHPIDCYRKFVGDGIKNLVRRSLPDDISEDMLQRYVDEMKSEYSGRWGETTEPYSGIPDLLDQLVSKQVRLSILSNKPHEFTLEMADKYLGAWDFEVVQGAIETAPAKPDPALALGIAEKMSLKSGDFLYLGDTNTDMKTAVNAGMYPVGALWGFREAEELLKSGARKLIEKPSDLLGLM